MDSASLTKGVDVAQRTLEKQNSLKDFSLYLSCHRGEQEPFCVQGICLATFLSKTWLKIAITFTF